MGAAIVNRTILALAMLVSFPVLAHTADAQRQAEVEKRGADVMPFDIKSTIHVFTKTAEGGTQRVVAKNSADTHQTGLVRQHLRDIQTQFQKGDFSGPSYIHGKDMPGLAQLKAAEPGQITIEYADVPGGAELTYRSKSPQLVSALHAWFDAQLSDHGTDAMEGHHHHEHMPTP